MKVKKSLTIPTVGQIAYDSKSEKPVYFGFDFVGNPLLLFVHGNPQFRDNRGRFVRTVFEQPHDYVVARLVNGAVERIVIPNRRENLQFAQPLPTGELIIAGARCHYRSDGAEKNSLIASPSGQVRKRFTLGDGIEDIQVSSAGDIWISYFDEGIFGNYGWKIPLGASGVTRWTTEGRRVFEFDPPDGLDHPADCYALNVANDGVWFCYYMDFPLVCLREGSIDSWTTDGHCSHALAVSESLVAFLGSYKHRDRLIVCRLDDGRAIEKMCCTLRLENGASVTGHLAAARGSKIGVFADGLVAVHDISDLDTAAR